jgi:DNA-binding LacI/PurR family transcriptional regulator
VAKPLLKYKQIASDIIELIDREELKSNDQIMPVSELCNKYNTSHVTVLKALNVLREEGYVVSQRGRGYFVSERNRGIYSGKKLGAIGVLVRPMREINYCDDYYNRVNIGIQIECAKQHLNYFCSYSTGSLSASQPESRSLKNIERSCMEMADQVDGFVFDKRISDEVVINVKRKTGKPIVVLGRFSSTEVDCVMNDCKKAPEDIVRTLHRFGYEYFILGDSGYDDDEVHTRAVAFKDAFKQYNIPEKNIARFYDYYINPLQESYETVTQLYRKNSQGRKTAVIADGDKFARDFCTSLLADGITPGKDIGVVGYGKYGCAFNATPQLTTADVHPELIGKMAINVLQERLNGGAYSPYKVHSPESTFIIGETI